jgi:lantibiotic modifying enzyme
METDKVANRSFIYTIIATLKDNFKYQDHGGYWLTPSTFYYSKDSRKILNYGIPHGSNGIALFLLKCCEVYNLHVELMPILESYVNRLIDQLSIKKNKLKYCYFSNEASGTGKLGWCYGDQSIAFTLLRYYEVFDSERAKEKSYELIHQAAAKSLKQTGVRYYSQYDFYDLCLCHGTSGIAYMWHKMYQITNDDNLKALADDWLNITLDSLEVFLPQLEKISRLEKGNREFDTSMGFLNGLSGVGLVLISFLNPKLSNWDKLLLLDRPDRE